MSREIKFRAWDEDGFMVHSPFLLELKKNDPITLWQSSGVYGDNGSAIFLMQSTGLKDKNGTEVYEGDIVDFFCQEAEVFWEEAWGCWSVVVMLSGAQEKPMPELLSNVLEKIEVIGNIYEGVKNDSMAN